MTPTEPHSICCVAVLHASHYGAHIQFQASALTNRLLLRPKNVLRGCTMAQMKQFTARHPGSRESTEILYLSTSGDSALDLGNPMGMANGRHRLTQIVDRSAYGHRLDVAGAGDRSVTACRRHAALLRWRRG